MDLAPEVVAVQYGMELAASVLKVQQKSGNRNKQMTCHVSQLLRIFTFLFDLILQTFNLIQIFRTAKRRLHFVSIVKGTVIDGVFPNILPESHKRLKSVTPKDFGWEIG